MRHPCSIHGSRGYGYTSEYPVASRRFQLQIRCLDKVENRVGDQARIIDHRHMSDTGYELELSRRDGGEHRCAVPHEGQHSVTQPPDDTHTATDIGNWTDRPVVARSVKNVWE